MSLVCLTVFLLLSVSANADGDFDAALSISPINNIILVDQNGTFSAILSDFSANWTSDSRVEFTLEGFDEAVAFLPNETYTLDHNETRVNITFTALSPGVTTATVHIKRDLTSKKIDTLTAFALIQVYQKSWLSTMSVVIGYIYTVAWSVSFYPQMITNFRRKSVVGLNFDFLAMNIVGFVFYTINTAGLYFNAEIQREFFEAKPNQLNQAELNDVVFCFHAVFATLVTIMQCFLYERGGQKVSRMATAFVCLLLAAVGIHIILIVSRVTVKHPWYTLLDLMGTYKMLISLIKYVPQAVMNYRRQSTEGWSIGNVLLDFTGGLFSFLQLFINSFNFHNWSSIYSNPAKLGLSLISIGFDILFMVQHYCLYRDTVVVVEVDQQGFANPALEEEPAPRYEFPVV